MANGPPGKNFPCARPRSSRFVMIEMKDAWARSPGWAGSGDAGVENRFGIPRHIGPYSERREQALAGIGDGRRAPVEAGFGERPERHPVDQDGIETGVS